MLARWASLSNRRSSLAPRCLSAFCRVFFMIDSQVAVVPTNSRFSSSSRNTIQHRCNGRARHNGSVRWRLAVADDLWLCRRWVRSSEPMWVAWTGKLPIPVSKSLKSAKPRFERTSGNHSLRRRVEECDFGLLPAQAAGPSTTTSKAPYCSLVTASDNLRYQCRIATRVPCRYDIKEVS